MGKEVLINPGACYFVVGFLHPGHRNSPASPFLSFFQQKIKYGSREFFLFMRFEPRSACIDSNIFHFFKNVPF